MTNAIRPIDQSRASQLALASMRGDEKAMIAVLDEAQAADGGLQRVLAAAVRSWMFTSQHYGGRENTVKALQAAIFDADLADD